jgi:hypothetical protein
MVWENFQAGRKAGEEEWTPQCLGGGGAYSVGWRRDPMKECLSRYHDVTMAEERKNEREKK